MKGTSSDVIIVGAGIMGLAAAMSLADRGCTVTVLEQFELNHLRGSSHGASRIFRLTYEETDYVRLAVESLRLWRGVEERLPAGLIRPTGVLDIGPAMRLDPLEVALCQAEVAFQRLSSSAAEQAFPNYRIPPRYEAIYQPDGGIIFADAAIHGFMQLACRSGACVLPSTRVTGLSRAGDAVRVETPSRAFQADAVVLATAGWTNNLLNKFGISVPLRVTAEHVAYYATRQPRDVIRGRTDADTHQPAGMNGWLPFIWHEEESEICFYGLPNGDTGLFKVGRHQSGLETLPDEVASPDEERVKEINRFVASNLRGLAPTPSSFETCLYASTPDDDFILDRIENIVLAAGFGGHGFKFAPLIGRLVADLVEGGDIGLPRFSLERFQASA